MGLRNRCENGCHYHPRRWDRYPPALFACREVPPESLGFLHFKLLFECRVRGPLVVIRQAWTDEEAQEEVKTTAEYVTDLGNKLEEMCGLAKENLSKSASRYAEV